MTSVEGYFGILSSGFIEPNDGRFPDTFERSAHSYGRSRGYISLFDFETPTLRQCVSEEPKWAMFFVQREPALVLMRLDRCKLAKKLVPNETAKREVGYGLPVWMPHVEVWYPDPIPIDWVTRYCLIIPKPSVTFEMFGTDEKELNRLKHAIEMAKGSYVHEDDMEILARMLGRHRDQEPP